MKAKLDENLSPLFKRILAAAGIDVATALEEGLGGVRDEDMARAARSESRVIFTLDRGFGDIRRVPARYSSRYCRPAAK